MNKEHTPPRVLKVTWTDAEFALINWSAKRKLGRGVNDFVREAIEDKIVFEADLYQNTIGELKDFVRDGVAEMKLKRLYPKENP